MEGSQRDKALLYRLVGPVTKFRSLGSVDQERVLPAQAWWASEYHLKREGCRGRGSIGEGPKTRESR